MMMAVRKEEYLRLKQELDSKNITLVAVSKTKPVEDILELYHLGQRDFGENYVQELVSKQAQLPKDIRWHFIGHLQSNKVKVIAPFVHLIQSVDSSKLLIEINKQAEKNHRIINVLLQVHIAQEETKFGLDEQELSTLINSDKLNELKNVRVIGLMGMASFTQDEQHVREEFKTLKKLFNQHTQNTNHERWEILSMGMSGDYKIAAEEGSKMVRIGSLLFGERH